jgi:hypothetical protein
MYRISRFLGRTSFLLSIACCAALSLTAAAEGQTSQATERIGVDRDGLLTERAAIVENVSGQANFFVAKNNKEFEFAKDKEGRLLGMKKIGGLEIKFKYRKSDSTDPTEVKIGNRRWVDVSNARKKTTCSPAVREEASEIARDTRSLALGEGMDTAPNSSSLATGIRKFGEDDPITQQDLNDVTDMVNAMQWMELSAARDRCFANCDRAATAATFICVALAAFAGVGGVACELTVGVHWLACQIGCSTIP